MTARLLYLVGQLRAGGLERQLCFLLQAMDRERCRPAVAVWRFREDDPYVARLREMEVPIHFPPSGSSGAGKLLWIRSLTKELRPEVIHSYSFHTNLGAWYAAAGRNIVAVGSVRSDFERAMAQSGPFLGRLCGRWPRTQVFNSAAAADIARACGGPFVPRQIHAVRNGLDLSQFRMMPSPNGGMVKIVGIGSLMAVKRWDLLVNAAGRLKRQGLDFSVEIAGDGPLRDELSKLAQSSGAADRVTFVGHTEDIPGFLCNADLLVHTSDSEGCPNVVMEAMACGRPVIATDAGDTLSLVDHEKTGFIVGRGDDKALAERMATLIENRELSRRMGEAARAKAEREFGLDRLVEQTLAAYRAAGWNPAVEEALSPASMAGVQRDGNFR